MEKSIEEYCTRAAMKTAFAKIILLLSAHAFQVDCYVSLRVTPTPGRFELSPQWASKGNNHNPRGISSAPPSKARALNNFFYALTAPFPDLRKVLQSRRQNGKGTDGVYGTLSLPIQTAIIAIVVYIVLGVSVFQRLERWSMVDSLYFSMVCFSTVGYGDLCPVTAAGKLFTCFFGFSGIALLGAVIASLGSKLVGLEVEVVQRVQKEGRKKIVRAYDLLVPKVIKKKRIEAGTKFPSGITDDRVPIVTKADSLSSLPSSSLSMRSNAWKVLKWISKSLLIVLTGGMLIGRLENWTLCDSIYYAIITGTTIGLGDFSPQKQPSRVVAIIMIPTLVAAAGEVLAGIGLSLVERRQRAVYQQQLRAGLSLDHIKAMDSDGDGKVSREEYIYFMLVQMGAVTNREIEELSSQFGRLDVTRSGYIEMNDVLLMHELRRNEGSNPTIV